MNIFEKINAIMAEVESLQKDGKISFGNTKYNYLSEAKTTEQMRKQLVKQKLVLLPIKADEQINGSVTHGSYTYELINAENPEERITLQTCGQGHDSADKGSGKASSYAYKYLLWRAFAIPSNDDPDQVSSDEINAKEADEAEKIKARKVNSIEVDALAEELKRTGVKMSQIIKEYKVTEVEHLTFEDWKSAMSRLEVTPDKKDLDL